MTSAMDGYLDYLRARIEKLRRGPWKGSQGIRMAEAEYNRALDYARRHNLTDRYRLVT